MIGQTVSHYKITGKIGAGGMGEVYKAEDTRLGRTVALKFLSRDLSGDPELKERLLQEARAASSLDHINICTIYECDETDDSRLFIAMAYYEGETLKDKIRHGPLSTSEAVDIALQTAAGLQKAHDKGIIHRDIKPANLFITSDGQVKILDFGLAKLTGDVTLTRTGTTMGTVAYMSPEQARGEKVDHRTDLWSLGVMLYEMLTGKLPFPGDNEQAVIYSILNKEYRPARQIRPEIPEVLESFIKNTLTKEPKNRFQNTGQLIVDLSEIEYDIVSKKSSEKKLKSKIHPSIAVLPFLDLSPQSDQEYFCEGMAEELINGLSKIENLKVASRTASFQFERKGYDINEIGKKLNVQNILEGSIRKSGNRLRITAQLINSADGFHIWSEKFDRDLEDVFALQDEIALAIVDKLKLKLLMGEKEKLIKHHTADKEAHNAYLKGLYFWNRRNDIGFDKALSNFQEAIKIDPNYALPYVGIANTYNVAGHFCFFPPELIFSKAWQAVTNALKIDEKIGEAHVSLGWIHTYFDRDWNAAEREYRHGIEFNPNYATGHEWFSLFLMGQGRFDEAIYETQKALELDPISPMINAIVGVVYYFARQDDKAIEQFLKALEINPDFPWTYVWLAMAYMEKKLNEKALDCLKKATRITQDITYMLGYLGQCYARSGQPEESKKVLDRLNILNKKKYVAWSHRAFVYAGLGESDKLFECWEKAYESREPELYYIYKVPWADPFRTDSRYEKIVKKMKFPS